MSRITGEKHQKSFLASWVLNFRYLTFFLISAGNGILGIALEVVARSDENDSTFQILLGSGLFFIAVYAYYGSWQHWTKVKAWTEAKSPSVSLGDQPAQSPPPTEMTFGLWVTLFLIIILSIGCNYIALRALLLVFGI